MKNKQSKGVSLKTINYLLVIVAVFISGMMLYVTFELSDSFYGLTVSSDNNIKLGKATHELMNASDHLTEKVQRFTATGEMRFLNEYFEEAFVSRRREAAIAKMSQDESCIPALKKLKNAMHYSLELMNLDYYAMRLVIEAQGYTEYPELLKSVKLSDKDQALTNEEKMRLATKLVLSDDYYKMKNNIRINMRASLYELEQLANATNKSALGSLHSDMLLDRSAIIIQTLLVFSMVWLTSHLGLNPILDAVKHIRSSRLIPDIGASEIKYLAGVYNKMYELYKANLERLSFKASHDELTDAYNLSGYDLLLSSVDTNSTYMLVFHIDDFKELNDKYGHETGNKVLIKLTKILQNNFLSDGYVCRIEGAKFAVLKINSIQLQNDQIASRIKKITKELGKKEDGLPTVSVSVGVAHGLNASNAKDLFEKANKAMYQAKQKGKENYAFYSE